jgi:DASH complex subunit DAD3
MSSPVQGSEIFDSNPYESHPNLSALEAEVLWEYAKLAQHLKEVTPPTATTLTWRALQPDLLYS